ncbi:hypothetical protein GCM10008904_24820 [Paraclostridium ghonii]
MKPTVKCPVFGKDIYLHHKYKYHISFKCNNKKCNHTFKQIITTAIVEPSSEKLNGKNHYIKKNLKSSLNIYQLLQMS